MAEMLSVGDLTFEIRRSSRRKTIAIIVDRGGQLIVAAPQLCESDTLEMAICKKKEWIYTKLLTKEVQVLSTPPQKEFVSGEGFYYLGKSYRLQLIKADSRQAYTPTFRFFQGKFMLRKEERYNGRRYFVKWYTSRCKSWIEPRVSVLAHRIGVQAPQVQVIDLGYHWGSCSAEHINFHWRTIMLPIQIVEYIVVHEISHLKEPNHSSQFWRTVERVIPDWQERKSWLANHGSTYYL